MKRSIIDEISDSDLEGMIKESTSVNVLAQKLGYKHSPGKNTKLKIKDRVKSLGVPFMKKESSDNGKIVDESFEGRNLKSIGDTGEAYLRYQCFKHNIIIAKVDGDNAPYEFVIDVNGKLLKVQVKTTAYYKNGCSQFATGKPLLRGNKFGKQPYKEKEVDYFYLFNTVLEVGYLLPFDQVGDSMTTIRKEKSKNNQSKNIKQHSDWLFEKVIKEI